MLRFDRRTPKQAAMARPDIVDLQTGAQFNNWYWLKAEMQSICEAMGLPKNGSKFELRDRIIYALDHDGARLPPPKKPKPSSRFNWAKAELAPTTVITDNVSFGPNLRRFMISQIDQRFAFNTEFMAWMKANVGKTLADAVTVWKDIQKRRKDPNFRTDIADHNMFNQYTRDYLATNPHHGPAQVRSAWAKRRQQPAPDGFIRYAAGDEQLATDK